MADQQPFDSDIHTELDIKPEIIPDFIDEGKQIINKLLQFTGT